MPKASKEKSASNGIRLSSLILDLTFCHDLLA